MTSIAFDGFRAPISEDAPCGSDLDQDGDADYLNLMAQIEGLLPESYYLFDRNAPGLDTAVDDLAGLMARTRDLRILTLLAKLLLFDRKLTAFSACMASIAWFLDQRWADVHPSAEGGLRGAILQTLDDIPHVIFPLQYVPLIESRRFGDISFRSQQLAIGESKARPEETALEVSAIEQAIADCDLPGLIATRDEVAGVKASVALIRSAWIANAGFDEAPSLDNLSALVEKMFQFLDSRVGKRDPAAQLVASSANLEAEAGMSPSATAETAVRLTAAPILSTLDASNSLSAVIGYFAQREPSNPALLLIRQARDLVGKNFIEVLRALVPESFDQSRISIGPDQRVAFPLSRLSELMANEGNEETLDETEEPGGESRQRIADVKARPQAVAELEQVSVFYRNSEPSSPIPLLIDRARALIALDFMTLLREIAPRKDG